MAGLYQANIGAGIAEGAASAPDVYQRRKAAEQQSRLAEAQLQEYQANAPVRQAQRSNEIAQLEAQTYQTNANLARQQSFDAFKLYDVDGDARHLNNWLNVSKTNPVASRVTSGMTRLDNLVRTPDTEKMLRSVGIRDLDGFFSDPNLTKNFVLGTAPDGSQKLVDMSRMYAATGYAQYTTSEQQKQLAANFAIMQQLRQGANMADIKANDAVVGQLSQALGLSRDEVYRMLREQPEARKGAGNTSMLERIASELRAANPDLSYRDSLTQAVELTSRKQEGKPTNEAAFIGDYLANNPEATREEALAAYRQAGKDTRTSAIKNTEYAEEAKVELDNMFDGDFLTADISKLTSRQEAEMAKYVNRLEQVGSLELSTEDKKNARAIRKLMSVARTAGEGLTAEQTGPIDSVLRSVKSYLSDSVDGKEATAAYEAFRAISRNALFGSQVSNADYKAFNTAVSNLQQQTGPVLVSLKTQLQILKDDLQSMADLNDPYVAKARFGVSLDELDSITLAVQDRIDIIDRLVAGKPVEGVTTKPTTIKVNPVATEQPTGGRKSLDEIFGGQ